MIARHLLDGRGGTWELFRRETSSEILYSRDQEGRGTNGGGMELEDKRVRSV